MDKLKEIVKSGWLISVRMSNGKLEASAKNKNNIKVSVRGFTLESAIDELYKRCVNDL